MLYNVDVEFGWVGRWLRRDSSWTTTPTCATPGTGWTSSSYSQVNFVLLKNIITHTSQLFLAKCVPPHTTLFFSIVKNYSFFTKHVKKDTSHLHYIILIWSGLICWVPCTTGYFLIESALKMYRLLHRTKLVEFTS